jgi:hypothetical protein
MEIFYSEDGARERFFQTDPDLINRTVLQLITPRLFSLALPTSASEQSVSLIPTRTIDMVLAHIAPPRGVSLNGYAEAVEVTDDTMLNLGDLHPLAPEQHDDVMLAEVHTLGGCVIRLKLETDVPMTVHEKRQRWNDMLKLPAVPFRFRTGGLGTINTANIARTTVSPPFDGIEETAQPEDLKQSIRS